MLVIVIGCENVSLRLNLSGYGSAGFLGAMLLVLWLLLRSSCGVLDQGRGKGGLGGVRRRLGGLGRRWRLRRGGGRARKGGGGLVFGGCVFDGLDAM